MNKKEAMEAFWKIYPARNGRKVNKKKAMQELDRFDQKGVVKLTEILMNQIDYYERNAKANDGFIPFFPDAFRWIKDERYEDEFQETKTWQEKFLEATNE